MKKTLLLVALTAGSACFFHSTTLATTDKALKMKLHLIVNQQRYDLVLADNATAKEFVKQLPLTLNMQELNGNEKFAELPSELPPESFRPETINKGDLMLYGNKTAVLFYKTFPTSYQYSVLGRVVNNALLDKALGTGTISVTFVAVE